MMNRREFLQTAVAGALLRVPRYGHAPLFIGSGPNGGDIGWTRRFLTKLTEKGEGALYDAVDVEELTPGTIAAWPFRKIPALRRC